MPRIEEFKIKSKAFKPIKYTPWDTSPTEQANEAPPKMLEPLLIPTNTNQPPPPLPCPNNKQVQNNFKIGFEPAQNKLEPGSKHTQNTLKTGGETGFESGSEFIEEKIFQKPIDLSFLTGSQKKIFIYLVDSCYKEGGSNLVNINTTELSKLLCIPKDTIKTSLRRLQEKYLMMKKISKQGVGGFLRFEISEEVKSSCLEIQKNELLNVFKTGSETGSKTCFPSPIVSSSYINTTTTLPDDLKQIDCSPLSEIGFDESHIIQIHREHMQKPEISLSADIIQNSINALAFDLKYNNAINDFKRPPAVVLTYLLKKGQPYSSKTPEKVTTPREEAMRQYLLAQERKNLKNLEIEVKAKELALQDWLSNLSENELSEFSHNYESCPPGMPEKIYQTSKRKKATASAKEYFDTVVWPDKRQQILYEGETIK